MFLVVDFLKEGVPGTVREGRDMNIQKLGNVLLDCLGVLKKKSCDLARLKVVSEASLKSLRMDLSFFLLALWGCSKASCHQQIGCGRLSVVTHEEGGLVGIHFELKP
jgi:hypothetical protein